MKDLIYNWKAWLVFGTAWLGATMIDVYLTTHDTWRSLKYCFVMSVIVFMIAYIILYLLVLISNKENREV